MKRAHDVAHGVIVVQGMKDVVGIVAEVEHLCSLEAVAWQAEVGRGIPGGKRGKQVIRWNGCGNLEIREIFCAGEKVKIDDCRDQRGRDELVINVAGRNVRGSVPRSPRECGDQPISQGCKGVAAGCFAMGTGEEMSHSLAEKAWEGEEFRIPRDSSVYSRFREGVERCFLGGW